MRHNRGFTLVEMLVIAPIVILTIGSFIALIVSLTGEVLSSRGSNTLAYTVQDALNRIESDVKLSTSFLATNNIPFTLGVAGDTDNPQGAGGPDSTTPFVNVAAGQNPVLIINGLVTTADPMAIATSRTVYLANQPNGCGDVIEYSKNRPMIMNIIYFTDADGTLWRRTVLPDNYTNNAIRCGPTTTWQQPSCALGASSPFCRTNDVKLVEGVSIDNLTINYFTSAASPTPIAAATDPQGTEASRGTALQSATTAAISLTSKKTIAGRDISRTASLKVTRLDTNATSIVIPTEATAAPPIPVVSSNVSQGHHVTFTWPRVNSATGYEVRYRVNSGALTVGSTTLTSNDRSFVVEAGNHGDTVVAQVIAKNSFGPSTAGSRSAVIPIWAPIDLENNWSEYSSSWAAPSYTKTSSGVVLLRGLAKGGAAGTTLGRIPADYAPEINMIYLTSSYDAAARLDVMADGQLIARASNSTWYSLDGTAFLPGNPASTAISPLLNGWVIHDASNWHSPSYVTDASGRIHLRGVIRGGTLANNTPIMTLPAPARPAAENHHFAQMADDGFSMIYYRSSSGQIEARGAGSSYLSINNMYFPSSRGASTNCTTGWCTLPLANSWVNFDSTHTSAQYTRGSDGIVQLKGLVRLPSTPGNPIIANIPAAFCPNTKLLLPASSADIYGRIDIVPQSNGTCNIEASRYNGSWISLDGINFRSE